jgi:hypothetical protein
MEDIKEIRYENLSKTDKNIVYVELNTYLSNMTMKVCQNYYNRKYPNPKTKIVIFLTNYKLVRSLKEFSSSDDFYFCSTDFSKKNIPIVSWDIKNYKKRIRIQDKEGNTISELFDYRERMFEKHFLNIYSIKYDEKKKRVVVNCRELNKLVFT